MEAYFPAPNFFTLRGNPRVAARGSLRQQASFSALSRPRQVNLNPRGDKEYFVIEPTRGAPRAISVRRQARVPYLIRVDSRQLFATAVLLME